MSRLLTLTRAAVALAVIGLLVQMSAGGDPSWAVAGQDVERETVPTRTPTPGPVTPTAPPPPATHTPAPPPTLTPTPSPVATDVTPAALPAAGAGSLRPRVNVLLLLSGAALLLAGSHARQRRH